MNGGSEQDREAFLAVLERIEDARLRYFFLMLGSAIADYCDGQSFDKRQPSHGHEAPTN
jgi:hypothetical protein